MKFKLSLPALSIFFTLVITTLVSSNLNWGKDHWKGIIEADAKGYYAYLPAVFIYKDLNFGFFEHIEKEKYYAENLYYDYRYVSEGDTINKYYCGTALAELPFFLIAHFLSYLTNAETDGYSKLYPILINIAALFYLLIGLLFLNAALKTYNLSARSRALTLFAAVFGTNLFYYTIGEPGLSHIFSFAFTSMFFFYARQYFSSYEKKHILRLAVILGIIILIRPINGMVIFILPFAAGSYETLKEGFRKLLFGKPYLLYSFICFLAIISIQLIIYKISTGSFFVYSYGQEGFNFLSPHLFDILFSYKKGLFLYTPLLLLSFTGGYFLWKNSHYSFFTWFGFFLVITYFLSSWWMWYYGGSFSSRVYVEYIPFFMVLLGISIDNIKPKPYTYLYIFTISLLIMVCQIQTYQYRYYEIHWSEMTKEKYWSVFMRIDKLIK